MRRFGQLFGAAGGLLCACAHGPWFGMGSDAPMPAGSDRAACQAIATAWPELNRELQTLVVIRDEKRYAEGQAHLAARLGVQPVGACPVWREPLARLLALSQEFGANLALQHAAEAVEGRVLSSRAETELGGQSQSSLERRFVKLHQRATEKGLLATSVAWQIYLAEHSGANDVPEAKRAQRYVSNMGCDPALIQDGGQLGPPLDHNRFVALVKTPVLPGMADKLVSLQGQGPLSDAMAERYVDAALKYARGEGVARAIFVNTAAKQIPDFHRAVEGSGIVMPKPATYVEFDGWKDGALVTPQSAAAFATKVAALLAAEPGRSMLVVNCNAGQDRSGITNALVQLIMQADKDFAAKKPVKVIAQQGYASIDAIVANLKSARPYAISSAARYEFIYRGFSAYLAARAAAAIPTPKAELHKAAATP